MTISVDGHRVCVGAAGSTTGWGLVRSLRSRWPDLAVTAADTNPREQVAAASLATAFVRVPPARDAGYADAMRALFDEHRIDTYVPIHDIDLIESARAAARGAWPSVTVVGPSLAAAELCWDKLAATAVLARAGVPVPATICADAGAPAGAGPWIVKPRRGVGSVGVRAIDELAELTDAERTHEVIVQERCAAPELTIDAFVANDGRTTALCRERVEVKAGVCTKARLFADEQVQELAGAVAAACGLRGTFCMQVMRGRTGGWMVTDVNPRPGGGTAMSVAVGMDFHAAMVAAAWGADGASLLSVPDDERWVARGYVEQVL